MRSTLARHFRSCGAHPVIALLLIAASEFVAGKAHSQQVSGLTLHWDAPARCPQQSDLSERVRKLAGSSSSSQGALQADGTVSRGEGGAFHLRLLLRSGGLVSERDLESRSCADLTRAAAVAIALLLRPEEPPKDETPIGERVGDGPNDSADAASPAVADAEPERTPPASEVPAPGPEQPGEPPPEPPIKKTHGSDVRVRAPLAALSIGPLPTPDWGMSVAAGVSYASWRLWLEGSEWLRRDVPATAFPGYGARVSHATLSLRGCRSSRFGAFELSPCLVVGLEHVTATGTGTYVTPEAQHINWISAGGGLQGRVYLTHWFDLTLSVDGIIETSRPRLSIAGIGLVDQVGPAGFAATLGPEWIL
ncbi:MAG: hypothetical protein ABJB12_11310 [Pseudomonadota bacterium]